MDVMTALFADIEMADAISETSPFVAESMKNPLYKKMMDGLAVIGKRNNHLTEDELKQLKRNRDSIYQRQVINRIGKIDDLMTASKDTVEVAAILSRHKEALISGALSVATNFTSPVVNAIEESVYSGTIGHRKHSDGRRDYTAKRMLVASTSERINELANLSPADKRRARQAAEVVNQSDSDDPFDKWADQQIMVQKAKEARINASKGIKTETATGGTVETFDWSSLI